MGCLTHLMEMLGLTGRIDNPSRVLRAIMVLDRKSLNRLRRISERIGSWRRNLNLKERMFIEAVILVVDKIRSRLLLKLLTPIIMKLLKGIFERAKNPIRLIFPIIREAAYRKMRELARRLGRLAASWGNKSAREWHKDGAFIECLTINRLYSP